MMLDAKQKETVEQIVKCWTVTEQKKYKRFYIGLIHVAILATFFAQKPKQCKNVFVSANNPALSVVNIIEYAVKARRLHNVGVFQAIRA
ncbi:hypothetical protein [Phascolarctobacterium succinatutens]|uniref:hypothetical protein n=1 Tax=Phascolarctobacterium succinatutens TaxID=626940 RepID=UPI00265DD9DE|nr:hypothetical protein [Phascolarctobacterium succinatutens]